MATAFTQETDTSQPRFHVRLTKVNEDPIFTFTWAADLEAAQTRMAEQTADPLWSGWTVAVHDDTPRMV